MNNLRGQLWRQFDQAGRVEIPAYDFMGRPLAKERRVMKDNLLTGQSRYTTSWNSLADTNLETKVYSTDLRYDALGRVLETKYPEDVSSARKLLRPAYNNAGAIESILFNGQTVVSEVAYNARGQRILMAAASILTRYAYDAATFRLARIRAQRFTKSGNTYTINSGTVRFDRGYTYDLMGSVIEEHDKTPKPGSTEDWDDFKRDFVHDPLRRLISATGRENTAAMPSPPWEVSSYANNYSNTNAYTRNYSYDKLGNILSLQHIATGHSGNNFTRNYNYADPFTHNRLSSFTVGSNTYHYTYDANGNILTENADRHLDWNFADKLTFFKKQAGTDDPSIWVHYLYAPDGTRVKKVVNKDGGIQEVTVYIDGIYEHSYTKKDGTIRTIDPHYNTLHISDGEARIATLRVGFAPDDASPAEKLYISDHLGNCSVTVQTNGARYNLEEYFPFGETSFGSFAKKRYRYNGKERDNESGYYEYGQRYYAPWLCRFVSVDPIAEDYPQLSGYNYASNRPETSIDLEGLQTPDEPKGISENAKEARSAKKYDKKFQKILSEEIVNNSENPAALAHERMAETYNDKKWMWVKDKSGKDTSKGYGMGSSGTGNKYFHIGELVREEATITITGNPQNIQVLDPTTFGTTSDGQQQIIGLVYQVPVGIQGRVTFNIQQAGDQWSVAIHQGVNPQETDIQRTTALLTSETRQDDQSRSVSADVNANNGNILYLILGNRVSGTDSSLSSSGISASVTSLRVSEIKKPYSPRSLNSKSLNKGTLKNMDTVFRNKHGIPLR